MKRFISLLVITITYSFATITSANAIFCSNCSTIFTQIPQLAKEVVTAGASVSTQINTYTQTLKLTVLDPLANAMIALTLLKQQAATINLVTGAMGGQSLLIGDPEQWVKNQGLNVLKVSLNDVEKSNGLYGGSLLNSLTSTARGASDLKTMLQTLSNSSIPSTTQDNLCRDVNLTTVARNDVTRSDGTYDVNQVAARKQQLYDQLCRGNPLTNSTLAKQLMDVSTQRPDIGGWDTWLALTNGDNPYARSVQANLAVAQAQALREQTYRDDLNRSGGIASPQKCLEQVSTTDTNIANIACRVSTFTNTGAAVNSNFQAAINSGFQRLTNSFGSGVLDTLMTLLAARNTVGLLTNAFGGSSSSGTASTPSQGDAALKDSVAKPVLAQLSAQKDALSKLEVAHQKLRAEIDVAVSRADEIGGCYQSLVDRNMATSNDASVVAASRYVTKKKYDTTSLKNGIDQEASQIVATRSLITRMEGGIATASTADQVNTIYKEYSDKLAAKEIPDMTAAAVREGQYEQLKAENQQDKMEDGEGYTLAKQCANIESSHYSSQGGN